MVKPYGELRRRRDKNLERLMDDVYADPLIFEQGGEWYGDWQGRAMLALCCHWRAADEASVRERILGRLRAIVDHLPEHTNGGGFFGPEFDPALINEQQLSGNSWFLRGLCAYYAITADVRALQRLQTITESLLCPLAELYRNYPSAPREDGSVSGHTQEQAVNGWQLSSDVGCAFILLDGVTDVYATTRDERLCRVIENMIAAFMQLDVQACHCQTHATLSALRGVERYYCLCGKAEYLSFIEQRFSVYEENGMTLNYANFNWFGKPFWTEPCVVVDSLLLSLRLYSHTGRGHYVRLANRIYGNALRHAQRPNGGAGCDSCLCEYNDVFETKMYEAAFCCSMRYAEGLSFLLENALAVREGCVEVLCPFSCEYAGEGYRVQICCTESEEGADIELQAEGNIPRWKIYRPCDAEITADAAFSADEYFVLLEKTQQKCKLSFCCAVREESRRGCLVPMRGDSVLLQKVRGEGPRGAIESCLDMTEQEVAEYKRYL